MIYSDNAINILTVKTYKGIGKAWIVKNLSKIENIVTIVTLLNKNAKEDELTTVEEFEQKKERIKQEIQQLIGFIDGIIAIGDKDFPPYRGRVKNSDQPIFLFYRGNLNLLNPTNKNIALIGLLTPDPEIEIIEQKIVSELVINGATIVSGLALGCDTIAHQQTLNLNGKTVAIIPSPLSNIMPGTNKELAEEIVRKNGLLITEYYNDAKSKMELGGRYQERDRLQALYSDCIILAASYTKNDQGNDSGSRLAMEYAHNYSIPRAVIYDTITDVNNPKYDLNRQLIQEQKNITIINQNNLKTIIKKIISIKPEIISQKTIQPNLFNLP